MPSRDIIAKEITRGDRQDLLRRKYLKELSEKTGRNTILYATAYGSKKLSIQQLPDILVSITQEDIQGFMAAIHGLKGDELDLIIHSPGGSAEVTEQIVYYLRKKFNHIRAIVPQNAMSAATMLCCGCDELIMAKHSAIGPIDPQMSIVAPNGGRFLLPAQSILAEFDQAKKEVIQNPELAALWVTRINSYPHGFFQKCRDTIDLSRIMVRDWLDKYMYRHLPDGEKPGENISKWLCKTSEHKSHGRPLNFDVVYKKGLRVKLLEDDQEIQDLVLSIFHATMITFDITNCVKLIENNKGKGWFSIVEVQKMPSIKPPNR